MKEEETCVLSRVSPTLMVRGFFLIGLLFLFIQFMSSSALAQRVEHYDGYDMVYYDNGSKEIINGALNYLRWDGIWRPKSEMNISNGNWPYLYSENASDAQFKVEDTVLKIPKANIKFKTRMNSISYELKFSKTELAEREQNINLSSAFIDIPYSLTSKKLKTKYEDDFNLKYDRFHFRAGMEHVIVHDDTKVQYIEDGKVSEDVTYLNKSEYDLRIKNGQVRLIFKKGALNKLNGNIIIEINTWDIIGRNNSLWGGNVSFNNTNEVRATGNVELRQKVDDYALYTRFDEGSGRSIHNEKTYDLSNILEGYLEGDLGNNSSSGKYVTGKFGQAIFFNGINNKVLFNDDPTIRLPFDFTISYYLKLAPGVDNSDTDILRKGSTYTADPKQWYKAELTDNISHGDIQKGSTTYHVYDSMDRRDGNWHFYVFSRNLTSCSFKVDGTTIDSAACANDTSNTAQFSIGSKDTYNQTSGLDFTNGTIDEVKLYSRILNFTELDLIRNNSHYSSGTITRNLTSLIGAEEEITRIGCNGTWDRSITKVDILASANNISWSIVQSNASANATYEVSQQNNYSYSRCALSTANASLTPVIESIRTSIGPKPLYYINGTIMDNVSKAGISGAFVSTNATISTFTNATGFYSIEVPSGSYNLTASFDPTYYQNSTIVNVQSENVIMNIELSKKPAGNISGTIVI